jgi:hypothetical protein
LWLSAVQRQTLRRLKSDLVWQTIEPFAAFKFHQSSSVREVWVEIVIVASSRHYERFIFASNFPLERLFIVSSFNEISFILVEGSL